MAQPEKKKKKKERKKIDTILNNRNFSWILGANAASFAYGDLHLLAAFQRLLVVRIFQAQLLKRPALPFQSSSRRHWRPAFLPTVGVLFPHSFFPEGFRSAPCSFLPPSCKSLPLLLAKSSAFALNSASRHRSSLKTFMEIFAPECSYDF